MNILVDPSEAHDKLRLAEAAREDREKIWPRLQVLLPSRNVGRFGRPGDPINLVILGTQRQMECALREAAWIDLPVNPFLSIRAGVRELLNRRPFQQFPPMNFYKLGNRRQDF